MSNLLIPRLLDLIYKWLCRIVILASFHLPFHALAQTDSIIFKNGNTIAGEIKSLRNGVLTVETEYSKNDFTIKWSEVSKIFSTNRFLVTFKDGRRMNGTISSDTQSALVTVREGQQFNQLQSLDEIVSLDGLKSNFLSRLRVNIDVGMNVTRANNLSQFSMRSGVAYLADHWQLDANFNPLISVQDSASATRRLDGAINYKYFLQHDWYLGTSINFLANTEQAINLRTAARAGAGKLIIHSNRVYWGIGGGLTFNNESFTNGTEARNSFEAYLGTELNLFEIGDLSFFTNWYVYPSLTEAGRWRSDFQFDAKYKFLSNFYIRAGTTVNYDNKPAIPGKQYDYVFQVTVGWEFGD